MNKLFVSYSCQTRIEGVFGSTFESAFLDMPEPMNEKELRLYEEILNEQEKHRDIRLNSVSCTILFFKEVYT
jgi:hypothetical protein